MERRLAAILFTDVVGYTALMGRDEAAGRRVRARHESLVRAQVERYHGRWIEEKGDESLSVFPSALEAVDCALALQAELEGDSELSLRIGVHLGDVTLEGGRVYGDGVGAINRAWIGAGCNGSRLHVNNRRRCEVRLCVAGERARCTDP
jgi:class 3 adenylate cyclase